MSDWLVIVRDVVTTAAALTVILSAWSRFRETVEAWAKSIFGPDWPSWSTPVLYGIIIFIVFAWFVRRDQSQIDRVSDEMAGLVSSAQGQVVSEIDGLRNMVTAVENRNAAQDQVVISEVGSLHDTVATIEIRLVELLEGVAKSSTQLADPADTEEPAEEPAEPVETAEPAEEPAEPIVETRERQYTRGETNDHCQGPRTVRWPVDAAEGWSIDVTSVNVRPTVVSSRSTYNGIEDLTEDGFTIVGRIVNRGNCVRVFGETIARDGRGTLRVAGTYQERRRP